MKWYVAFRATVDGCVVSETMPAVPTVTVNVSSPRKRGSPSRTSASASVSVTYVFPLPETAFPFSTALTCVTHSPTSPAVPPIAVTEPVPSFFRDCPVHCEIQDGDTARAAARNIALNCSFVDLDGTGGGILHVAAALPPLTSRLVPKVRWMTKGDPLTYISHQPDVRLVVKAEQVF